MLVLHSAQARLYFAKKRRQQVVSTPHSVDSKIPACERIPRVFSASFHLSHTSFAPHLPTRLSYLHTEDEDIIACHKDSTRYVRDAAREMCDNVVV